MNTLVPFAPIPVPTNPAQLPSLPAWLRQRIAALESAVQPDSSGRHREMLVLPKNLILSSSEKQAVREHLEHLGLCFSLSQPMLYRDQLLTNDQAHGAMIAHLLMKGGGQKLDKEAADALTEDYLDAIEDLPAWTVREALRKWNRAESVKLDGKPHDFNWRPTPPTLRRLAQHEMVALKARKMQLEKLFEAAPLIEFSDEHRQMMINRVAKLLRSGGKGEGVNPGTQ
ncbi:hypothetical protein ACVIQT_005947 [Bradyrhizobium diazoefficiens]